MTPRTLYEPAPYKLIPFEPLPFFLALAGLAIISNLLVLLAISLKSLGFGLNGQFVIKRPVRARDQGRRESNLRLPSQRSPPAIPPMDGSAYEMDVGVGVGVGSSSEAGGDKRHTAGRLEVALGVEMGIGMIEGGGQRIQGMGWGPGGAAMRG